MCCDVCGIDGWYSSLGWRDRWFSCRWGFGMNCAGLNDNLVRCIIKDLSEGYGVEDIGHRGPATKEQARYVVDFMRKHGMMDKFYRKAKKKWKRQCKLQ